MLSVDNDVIDHYILHRTVNLRAIWALEVYFWYSITCERVIKSRRMRWVGHVARVEEGRGMHKVLVGKPEGKRPLGRPRRRWDNNIKMDLQEMERGCVD
jgi:hypothetical protein